MPGLKGTERRAKDTHSSVQESEKGKADSQVIALLLGALGWNLHKDWPDLAWNSVRMQMSCFYACGPRPQQFLHVSSLTCWWMANLPLGIRLLIKGILTFLVGNPDLQACQVSTSKNWRWPVHRKPGLRVYNRKMLWYIEVHSSLDKHKGEIHHIIGLC